MSKLEFIALYINTEFLKKIPIKTGISIFYFLHRKYHKESGLCDIQKSVADILVC